jgi:hypothetical protein
MKVTISIILTISMLGFTVLMYLTSFNRFVFAGGSTESLMTIVSSNGVLSTFSFVAFFLLLFFGAKIRPLVKGIAMLLLFILWLMSGRTIGTKLYPDGRLSMGWFYIETERLNVCKNDTTDCERITHYQTFVKKLPFWRLRIKNEDISRTIFIGPVVWSKAFTQLKEDFPAVAPRVAH